jgi:predicted RNA binding protein YcfA (HicA-like mRNA interferase family)
MVQSDLTKMVEQDGWRHVRATGSHRHFRHPEKPER